MDRVEKNLMFWKGLVGLEEPFPDLPPIQENKLAALMVTDPAQVDLVRSGIGSHQWIQVIVEPGWGCSTLFNFIFHDALQRAMSGLILPIKIDLETMFRGETVTHARLVETIKRQIVGLLIDNPWEQVLNRDYYFHAIHYDHATDLATYKGRMSQFLFADHPPSLTKLMAQFPWLKEDLPQILGFLLANFRIQTMIFFHFPTHLDNQSIRDLIRSLKTIHEIGAVDFAALREVYFCTPRQSREVDRDWVRPFETIIYPRYTYAQIYAMLVKRYTPCVPSLHGGRTLNLDAVFDEAFVKEAWQTGSSLIEVIKGIKEAVRQRLDCPEEMVSFKLTPKFPQPEAVTVPHSNPPPGVKRRRFRRSSSPEAEVPESEATVGHGDGSVQKGVPPGLDEAAVAHLESNPSPVKKRFVRNKS